MSKRYTIGDILAGIVAALLAGVLMLVYGWIIGLIAGGFFVVVWYLKDCGIVR